MDIKKDIKEMKQNLKKKAQQIHFFNSAPRIGRKDKNKNNNRSLRNQRYLGQEKRQLNQN